MKQVGGAVFAYTHALQELVLVGIAKAVEGLIVLARDLTGVYFDIWQNDELNLPHHAEARYVRALNNVVKHSRSEIVDDGSPGSRFLVEKCGRRYGDGVQYLDLDIPRIIYRVSVFCDALSAHLAGVAPQTVGPDEEAAIERFKREAIPEFLNL